MEKSVERWRRFQANPEGVVPIVRRYLLPVTVGVAAIAAVGYALLLSFSAYILEWVRAHSYIYCIAITLFVVNHSMYVGVS